MKKVNVQAWIPVTKLAEIIKGMHKMGIYRVRPSDIIRFCLYTTSALMNTQQLNEDEAIKLLESVGYSRFMSDQQSATSARKVVARAELEELIENARRAPSTVGEIKKMLGEPVKGVIDV